MPWKLYVVITAFHIIWFLSTMSWMGSSITYSNCYLPHKYMGPNKSTTTKSLLLLWYFFHPLGQRNKANILALIIVPSTHRHALTYMSAHMHMHAPTHRNDVVPNWKFRIRFLFHSENMAGHLEIEGPYGLKPSLLSFLRHMTELSQNQPNFSCQHM